jgi:glycosyltransferase involved in cell wall biosynthesis
LKINVFTDLRFTRSKTPTGVGKHILQMTRGLAADHSNEVCVLAARDQVGAEQRIPGQNELAGLPATILPLPWKAAEALWTVAGRPFADRWCDDIDWVYCPKNDFIPVRRTRVAVTIHGAAELDPAMPQSGTLGARLNRWRRRTAYRRMVEQGAVVLTVSEFLKGQVVDWFGADPERVVVVGNGVEAEFFHAAGQPIGMSGEPADRPFILCVGGLNYLDGGDRVLAAAHLLRRRLPDLRIIVAGCQHEQQMSRAVLELPNVTLLGYVTSDRLAPYMRDAVALLFPTRYETFGIAAAEAMAAGTPVVTCRSTAVPEVVGDAGIYVDPDHPEAIVEALMALQSQSGLRTELIACGRRRAQTYTWPACVARLQQSLERR